MADASELASVAVERRIVSVLFADLVGFTTLSEQLDPEDVATVQDAYFATTRETIERYGGTVEKFIGDAVMAVFGAPRARDDDAERAVRAGLALLGALEQIEARIGLPQGTLMLRVGVNSGEVVLATSGTDAGRVTGDTVNTAARLQAAAEPGTVLVGELTGLAVAETIDTDAIPPLELKGKADAVRARRALGARAQASREQALGELRAPTLGRDRELTHLRDALATAGATRSAAGIVIVAAPGVGKSRLLAELAATADADILRARVRPQATAPYEPVAQLLAGVDPDHLDGALGAAGVGDARRAVVTEEVRRLLEPGTAAIATATDLAAEREARFDAWVAALDAVATGPSAWLVEDVHWASGDLLAFLEYAGRAATRHGRLVVATARPSLLESAPDLVGGERIDLEPLAPADAGALVRALVGDALPDTLVAAVVERSDGTPLFIEELLRTWASVGTLVRHDDTWRLAVQQDAVQLPPTVQAIYAAQLDDLPPDARQVARRGAVVGRRIPVAALGTLDIMGREGLDALHRRAFVSGPIDDAITGEGYAYRHALLRDAGYASLARAERTRLHVAMAGWLASVAGGRADVVAEAVAEHYAAALASLPRLGAAGLPEPMHLAQQAAAWYERAADAALGLSAHDAASRLLTRAVQLTQADAHADLARRRLRLGEVLAASGDLDLGIEHLAAALELAADDPATTARAAYALALAHMQQIGFGKAEELAARTLEQLADAPPGLRARLHAMHAWAVSAEGRTEGVRDETDVAMAAAMASGDPAVEVDVLEHVASARDEIGDAGVSIWQELETKARAIERWHSVVVAGRVLGYYEAETDPTAALPRWEAAAELAAVHGLTEQAGWADYGRSELLWVLGRWDDALDLGLLVIDTADRLAYRRLSFRTWVVILSIAAARRELELAERWEEWWSAFVSNFPAARSPYATVLHAAIPIWVAQARGTTPEPPADDVAESVIAMSNPHFLNATETVVHTWLDAGRSKPAALAAERSAGFVSDDDATRLMRGSAALLEAWVGGSDDAARRALQIAREHEAPWWELRALRALADPAAAAVTRRLGIGVD